MLSHESLAKYTTMIESVWYSRTNPRNLDQDMRKVYQPEVFGTSIENMSIQDACGSFQGPMLTRICPTPPHRCAANGSTHLKGRVTQQRANNPNNQNLKRNHKYWR